MHESYEEYLKSHIIHLDKERQTLLTYLMGHPYADVSNPPSLSNPESFVPLKRRNFTDIRRELEAKHKLKIEPVPVPVA